MSINNVKEAKWLTFKDNAVLYVNSFTSMKLVLVVSKQSRTQHTQTLSMTLWDQSLTKVLQKMNCELEISDQDPDVKIASEDRYIAFYNLSKGSLKLYELPNLAKPILTLTSIEKLKAVALFPLQRRLFVTLSGNKIACYKFYSSDLEFSVEAESKQNIEALHILKEQKLLVANTVNEVHMFDVTTKKFVNRFETHKLPVLGRSNYDLERVVGHASSSNKVILKGKELSENSSGQMEREDVIEICQMNDLRKDMRFSLQTDVGFCITNQQGQEVIWSSKNSVYVLDLKGKEIVHLHTFKDNQMIISGTIIETGKIGQAKQRKLLVASSNHLSLITYTVNL